MYLIFPLIWHEFTMSQLLLSGRLKRKHGELSLQQRISLIQAAKLTPKPTLKQLAERFAIGISTVSDILRKQDQYINQLNSGSSGERQRTTRTTAFGPLNETLFEWFQKARSKGLPISGPILHSKAAELAEYAGITEFKASNGWMDSWKSTFNIKSFKICGEKLDADTEAAVDFRAEFQQLTSQYGPKDIFNADEFGLLFRCLPDRTLSVVGAATTGGKLPKDRLTVFICASMTGEKLKPLVIGKARCPRALKNIDFSTLPVIWRWNSNAWMTSAIFSDILTMYDAQMRMQTRKIILFVDNCSAHCQLPNLTNITLAYLPANTTSILQPLDQGVIHAVKSHYRKVFLRQLVAKMDSFENSSDAVKTFTVRDAIGLLAHSWSSLEAKTIQHCFTHAGFLKGESQIDVDAPDLEADPSSCSEMSELIGHLSSKLNLPSMPQNEFIDFECNCATEDPNEDWECALKSHLLQAISPEPAVPHDLTSNDDDDDDEQSPPSVSHAVAMSAFDNLDAFISQHAPALHGEFLGIRTRVEKTLIESRIRDLKQASIVDFFHPHNC